MKVSMLMANLTVKEFVFSTMAPGVKVCFRMIIFTDMGLRHRETDKDLKENILREESLVKVFTNGLMALPMMEISLRIIFKEVESTSGLGEGNMMDNG